MGNRYTRSLFHPVVFCGNFLDCFNLRKPVLRFERIHPLARIPYKATKHSAGYDIFSIEEVAILPGTSALVSTGLKFRPPKDCYLRIAPRSGYSQRTGTNVHAGVFDFDYTGNCTILLFNHSEITVEIKPGERVAQIIPTRIRYPKLEEVPCIRPTRRGSFGFGSSGMN